jgi:4a-hydroxytetrahydrobiopterin dehydratase
MREPLDASRIADELAALPGWRHEGDALRRSFELRDFRSAVAFIVRVAFEAEQRDHHPELLNVYNRVEITLTTHDAGNRVTAKDVELAAAIDSVA